MRYTGTFNIELLHEELEAAGYVVERDGMKHALYTMGPVDGGVDIYLTASTDYAALDEVIARHDHTKESVLKGQRDAKKAKKDQVLAKLGLSEEELRDLLS